jgi:hypothetical protein
VAAVNVMGGSANAVRAGWCTPEWLADIINLWDPTLDPCSNERSHVRASIKLLLDLGDNGLYGRNNEYLLSLGGCGFIATAQPFWRTFINPPYTRGEIIRWILHWCETDFIFLLKWAPDTGWFETLWPLCWGAWHPNQRINFEPPPGVKGSSNPLPHALYLKSKPEGAFYRALVANGYFTTRES